MASSYPFSDIYIDAPTYPLNESPAFPEDLEGLVLFGTDAKLRREECYRWDPKRWWQHAEMLDRIVSESNARFPSRAAQVVELELEPERLIYWLKRPSEWWPLCESLRGSNRILRIHIPAGTAALVSAKKLVNNFPYTTFWLDPFIYGPIDGWQGHVRLASYSNVFISTLGLIPMSASRWDDDEAQEALHFTVGEVGAGQLLYASGVSWDELISGQDKQYREWLADSTELDDEEFQLVMAGNAKRVFGAYKEGSGLGLP